MQNPQTDDEDPTISELEIVNILKELTVTPIKIINEQTAEERILQWKRQEMQCEMFKITAELYNLLHLVSLIQVYQDLIVVAEELRNNPDNQIKNIKSWMIKFMRDKLRINDKAE